MAPVLWDHMRFGINRIRFICIGSHGIHRKFAFALDHTLLERPAIMAAARRLCLLFDVDGTLTAARKVRRTVCECSCLRVCVYVCVCGTRVCVCVCVLACSCARLLGRGAFA